MTNNSEKSSNFAQDFERAIKLPCKIGKRVQSTE